MKIVDAGYEILDNLNGEEILKKIERVARVCYKSEDKITEGSAEKMVGEVTGYSTEKGTATVKLCDTGLEITVSLDDIESTGSTQPHRAFNSEVHILGTRYSIRIIDEDDYRYDREADGWCDPSVKEILIFNYKQSAESVKDLIAYQKKVLRHEIVHAFLYESGLWQNAYGSKCWAKNEEMIDWMAIQIPKIQRAYKEAYCDE